MLADGGRWEEDRPLFIDTAGLYLQEDKLRHHDITFWHYFWQYWILLLIVSIFILVFVTVLQVDELYSGTTSGRVLVVRLYTHRNQKLIFLHLFTELKNGEISLRNSSVHKGRKIYFRFLCVFFVLLCMTCIRSNSPFQRCTMASGPTKVTATIIAEKRGSQWWRNIFQMQNDRYYR